MAQIAANSAGLCMVGQDFVFPMLFATLRRSIVHHCDRRANSHHNSPQREPSRSPQTTSPTGNSGECSRGPFDFVVVQPFELPVRGTARQEFRKFH